MKTYTIDKSELKPDQRDLPFFGELETFVDLVAKANPLFDFVCNRESVRGQWLNGSSTQYICSVNVFQDGEELGTLSVANRGYGGVRELVFGVESFRITKYRGERNTTYSKDMKIALRTAKKNLLPRDDSELINLIHNNIRNKLKELGSHFENQVRWGVNMNEVAWGYLMRMYEARKEGSTSVSVNPRTIEGVKDMGDHDKRLDKLMEIVSVLNKHNNKEGYGITTQPDGTVVCLDYGTLKVTKYKDWNAIPQPIADKLAVFKLLGENECFANYGVKLEQGFYFIVKDALPSA